MQPLKGSLFVLFLLLFVLWISAFNVVIAQKAGAAACKTGVEHGYESEELLNAPTLKLGDSSDELSSPSPPASPESVASSPFLDLSSWNVSVFQCFPNFQAFKGNMCC